MTTPEMRHQMAKDIIDFEARRDSEGHLKVYNLPPQDGGGRYEVAGINERYDREAVDKLVELLGERKWDEAEAYAEEYIAKNTDPASTFTKVPCIESVLRDTVFNRGVTGCVKTMQHALRVAPDGLVGRLTQAAMAEAERNPTQFLHTFRDAREWYERHVVGRDEGSIFWKGLVNRWNNALAVAQRYPSTPEAQAAHVEPPPAPEPAPEVSHTYSWWVVLLERGLAALRKMFTPPGTIPVLPPKPTPPPDAPELHDLGSRIKRTMLAKGYPWATGAGEQNVVSVEGMDPDGAVNGNRPNAFDDVKMILDGSGKIIGGPWEGTTAPGKYWTQHPMAEGGAFIIALGPQSCWTPGPYHDHQVWRQAEDSTILGTRDPSMTFKRQGPPVRHGNIGVHHHGGYDLPKDDIRNAAAGCQVIRDTSEQEDFMRISKRDSRYLKDPQGFRLTATVLEAKDVLP